MKVRDNKSNKIYKFSAYFFVALFSIFCVIPFWLVITGSITKEASIIRYGYQMFPRELSFDAYMMIFTGDRVQKSYIVTITVTLLGTFISMLVTSMLAYAISVKNIKYSNHIAFYVFFTMLFSGGIVPWYILVTQYLKLDNTIWALILPFIVNPFYMFILRNFFKTIPESIMESARIDGANDFLILVKIVLPVSLPALATIGLFYSLWFWNDWWAGLMFIEERDLQPLQLLLRALVSNLMAEATALNPHLTSVVTPPAYAARMATSIITIGPIIFVYPFVQKYFIKGITLGAVKG